MTIFDPVRAAVDAAEKASNAEFDAWQVTLNDVKGKAAADATTAAATIADLKARLAKYETQAVGRFPGDPGVGKTIVGVASNLGVAGVIAREKDVGGPLAYRQYNNNGITDLAVPNGPLCTQIKRDHAAGRVPVVSPKPGIAALAAHQFEAELLAFFTWTEALTKDTIVIVHHEYDNDGTPAAQCRAAQQWVRTCLNKAAGGKPKRTAFIGSLMTYSWTPQGIAKFGPVDQWDPGKQADGTHVWDACGGDHYQSGYTGTTLDTAKWRAFVASVKSWGCLPAITELGITQGNPNGGTALAAFLPLAVERDGCPIVLYFDSSAGAGGKPQPNQADWWTLTSSNGTLAAFTDFTHTYGSNPNG